MNTYRQKFLSAALLLGLLLPAAAFAQNAKPAFALKPDDVVALAGGANIERTRSSGYLQTLLIADHPEYHVRVRNMGWEGDTVFEQWRDDSREQWRRSRDWSKQLADANTTVVLSDFGQMESLNGPEKIPAFITAYEKLLDQFAAPNRRLVLLSPIPFEKPPLTTMPDLTKRNAEVKQYVEAIRKLAAKRKLAFVDLFTPFVNGKNRLTENGYHLIDHGRELVALQVARQLGLKHKSMAGLDKTRQAVQEMENLWFNDWRPMNWAFLSGDRTNVPFSHDWHDPNQRILPIEMKEYDELMKQADNNIWITLEGGKLTPITVHSPISEELPYTPSQTPAQELATFKIRPEFNVSLFASEKDGIVKPIQMRFDERGRLWVACTVSYPMIKPGEKPNDRIVICEDTDGDGHADKFTTFVDGLFMPTGLQPADGGLYVAQGTQLLFFKDNDGDDHADEKHVILGGFGTADAHQMLNCISWGFGGEMWFSQGHHIYSRVETPYGIERLNRAGIWRFHPRTMRLDPFFQMSSAGANCWGVVNDDYGQVFHKSGANVGGYYSVPGLIRSDLALDGEPMRLFLARAKQVGFDILESKHFPAEMQGLFIIGGYYDNTLQLHKLDYKDGQFSSHQLAPIIETTNTVFRPVDVHMGPDGAIYFADWYNPIIGHYQASYRHPDRDKVHGRIWRVTYKGSPLVKPPKLAGDSIPELLAQLNSPERWVKDQTKRLLFAKPASEMVPALDKWVKTLNPNKPDDEHLRLQALSLYESQESVQPKLLKELLRSKDFRVRSYATRVLGHWNTQVPGALKLLEQQANDEHPRVRLEAVVASSYFNEPAAAAIAAQVLDYPLDSYIDHALIKAVDVLKPLWEPALTADTLKFKRDEQLLYVIQKGQLPNAPALIHKLMDERKPAGDKLRPWLTTLAAVGSAQDLRFVLDHGRQDNDVLEALATEAQTRKIIPAGNVNNDLEALLGSNDAALKTSGVRLAGLWHSQPLAARIQSIATDTQAPEALRIVALDSLANIRGKESMPVLQDMVDHAKTTALSLGALEPMVRISMMDAAKATAKRLASASSTQEAAEWLRPVVQKRGGYGALTKVLVDGSLTSDKARQTLNALNNMGRYEKALMARLSQLAGFSADLPVYSPEYIKEVASNAMKNGNAEEGHKLFQMLGCITCHIAKGEGGKIGPDLSALGRGLPVEGIVTEVIWPQLNVKEGFEANRITTRDGRILEGIKQSQTVNSVTLRDPLTGEVTTLNRSQIERISPGMSMMPEGLTAPLSKQQLADLVRFLAGLGK